MTIDILDISTQEEVTAFEQRVRELPFTLENHSNTWALSAHLVIWPYLTGEMPYHRDLVVQSVDRAAVRADALGTVVRVLRRGATVGWIVVGAGWVGFLDLAEGGDLSLSISATSEAAAQPVVDEVRSWVAAPSDEPARVSVTFMHNGGFGPVRNRRPFDVAEWSEIRRNYVAAVQPRVDELMAHDPETLPSGRLVLLHGPPGTGKTTLLRALAREWQAWCSTYVVVDPEVFFSNPSYLFDAVLGDGEDDDGRWRLFIIEDCDELIRAEAKERTGQALSRLLNLADGLVGQGTRALVCLTTNEEVGRLHPAVRRPGRCLAEIEVPRFGRAEARAWLGDPGADVQDASLAELLAMRAGTGVTVEHAPSVGQYL